MSLRRIVALGSTSVAKAFLNKPVSYRLTVAHTFASSKFGGRKSISRRRKDSELATTAPPPNADPWVEVLDKASGQVYWWNQSTNETTALGAPKPTGNNEIAQAGAQPQQRSMLGSLGSVVAEGMAFGVGSAVGHSVVASAGRALFGGGSDHGGVSSGLDDGGDDGEWDI